MALQSKKMVMTRLEVGDYFSFINGGQQYQVDKITNGRYYYHSTYKGSSYTKLNPWWVEVHLLF